MPQWADTRQNSRASAQLRARGEILDLFAKRRLAVWGCLLVVRLRDMPSTLCSLSANGQSPVNVAPLRLRSAVPGGVLAQAAATLLFAVSTAAFAVNPNIPSQPAQLSSPVGGTIADAIRVGPSGAAEYSVPLDLPPGTAGIAPALSLDYSSQSGAGLLGYGWSLSGLSSISRCGKSIAVDGVRRAVSLTTEDVYCLDGQRLLLTSGTHHSEAWYRTEVDQISWVHAIPGTSTASDGPASWEVKTKAGTILRFGTTTDSRVEAAGKSVILRWALSRMEDRSGNYVDIAYAETNATGEHYPQSIRYTGNFNATPTKLAPYNAVNFIYETRTDAWKGWVAGAQASRLKRIKAVQVRVNTAADGTGGTLVRDYRVSYDTDSVNGRSLVSSLQDCDGSANCLPTTSFTWSTRASSLNTFQAAGTGNWGGPAITFDADTTTWGTKSQQADGAVLRLDLNGDGRTDLLSNTGSSTVVAAGNWRACLSTGTAFNCQTWDGPGVHSRNVVAGDFAGDGKQGFLVPPTSPLDGQSGTWNRCVSTGTSLSCSTFSAPSYGRKVNYYSASDLDADGRVDLLVIGPQVPLAKPSWLCRSTGASFAACGAFSGTFKAFGSINLEASYRVERFSGDFNGDGRPDIAAYDFSYSTGDPAWTVYLGSETGYVSASTFSFKPSTPATKRFAPRSGYQVTADINQDPLDAYGDIQTFWQTNPDIFPPDEQPPIQTGSESCISTGVSLYCTDSAALTDLTYAGVTNVQDYDGDGQPDILYNSISTSVLQVDSNGTRTNPVTWTAPPNTINPRVWGGDYDGDGIPDIATYDEAAQSWTVSLAGGGFKNLLASVTNGLGHVTQIQYAGLDDINVYTMGAATAYPKLNTRQGPPVVSLLRASNGQGGFLDTAYKYVGLRTDQRGRGSLGFEKISAEDKVNGVTTVTTLSQDWPWTGMVKSVVATQANDVLLSSTTNTLDAVVTVSGSAARYPYLKSSTTTTRDLTGTLISTTSSSVDATCGSGDCIDAYGNVTAATATVIAGESFVTLTSTTYQNDSVNWLIGLPTRVEVTKSAPSSTATTGTESVTRTVAITYEPGTALVKIETVEPDSPSLKVTTTYARNATYGVVNTKQVAWTDPVSATAKTRTTINNVAYDSKFRWPTTVRNAKNHQEDRSYADATGRMLTLKGPNSLTTAWTYDGWGRQIREKRADGTATEWSYRQCRTTTAEPKLCDLNAVFVTTVRHLFDNGASGLIQIRNPQEIYADSLGRTVRRLDRDMAGSWTGQDTEFDAKARLAAATRPYAWSDLGTSKISRTLIESDALGRPVKIKTPKKTSGSLYDESTIAYDGLTVTRTDARTNIRSEIYNGLGKLAKVIDAGANTTAYRYDPFGNLRRTIDALGNQIVVGYDRLGRKTSLSDPDLGNWTYGVDPLGQTYQQKDARSKLTTFAYDELGRLTSRVEPDLSSSWVYDTAATGVGKLAEAYTGPAANKDYRQVLAYDALGRTGTITTSLDWDYATTNAYDSYGRGMVKQTHARNPRGGTGGKSLVIDLEYNAYGTMYRVKRGATTMWERKSEDPSGRLLAAELNGATARTVRSYNAYTGRLQAVQTGPQTNGVITAASIQDDGYDHDVVGNLLSRKHLIAPGAGQYTETFAYDSLDRLSSSTVAGQPAKSYGYDDIGNLSSKTGVGSYTYGQAAPVAMAMIFLDDDLFIPVPIGGPAAAAAPAPKIRPHAVRSIAGTVAGLTNPSFSYDANGNLLNGLGRAYTWSTANQPLSIDKLSSGAVSQRTEFIYGPERQRTRQVVRTGTAGAIQRQIYYAGAIEKELDYTNNKTLIRTYLPMGVGFVEQTLAGTANDATVSPTTTADRYLHTDHLGSVIAITDSSNATLQRLSYDAWGRRRNTNGTDDPWSSLGAISNALDHSGYTGQEQIDQLGLVHLNGRVYDPIVARMTSADPMIPGYEDPQALNRYAYVLNNPLMYVDPTGHFAVQGEYKDQDLPEPKVDEPEVIHRFEITGSRWINDGSIARGRRVSEIVRDWGANIYGGARYAGKVIYRAAPAAGGLVLRRAGQGLVVGAAAEAVPVAGQITHAVVVVGFTVAGVVAAVDIITEAASEVAADEVGDGASSENTNPYNGPVDKPVVVVDQNGNAIPVDQGQRVNTSPNGDYQQVIGADGKPTGDRLDRGGHRGQPDPLAQGPHGHRPGVTTPNGNPHLPINMP
jgi:RHS repeat-associated protein